LIALPWAAEWLLSWGLMGRKDVSKFLPQLPRTQDQGLAAKTEEKVELVPSYCTGHPRTSFRLRNPSY
jgi:hypothetical protein